MLIDDDPSDFGQQTDDGSGAIDFSRAVRLERSGSTCDTYVVRHNHKTVFVKRLKEELRGNPRVRAAFAKEYEIGMKLHHQALPTYRSLHDDYIVIDYVDGTTLADMIKTRNPWLMDAENIRGMLRRLVEVVGYLHECNVLHSDIKVDNVMITHGTHNTMLIDLDKAYSPTHNDTAGAPDNYDLAADDHGNPAIDFNGIAIIIDRLTDAGFPTRSFRHFRHLCRKQNVTCDKLLKALDRKDRKPVWIIVAMLGVIAGLAFCFVGQKSETERVEEKLQEEVAVDTIPVKKEDTEVVEVKKTPESQTTAIKPDDYETIINRDLTGYFTCVEERISEAKALLASGTATDSELRDANYEIIRASSLAIQTAYRFFEGRFSDVGATKVQLAVANSPAYRKILDSQTSISQQIAAEIIRRHPESYNTPENSVYTRLLEEKI